MSKHLMHECLAYVLRLVHLFVALAGLVLVCLPASTLALVAARVGHGMPVRVRGHDYLWRCGVARGWRVVGTAD